MKRHQKEKYSIVIGAGPVGLWTAALLSLFQRHVIIFEKRSFYTRTQPIRIWPGFYAKLFLYPIFYTEKGRRLCHIFEQLDFPFQICELEHALKAWLLTEVPEYVTFRYMECKSWEDLVTTTIDFESIEWIYACDGAHSSWRRESFSTDVDKEYDLVIDLEHTEMSLQEFEQLKKDLKSNFPYKKDLQDLIRLSSTRSHITLTNFCKNNNQRKEEVVTCLEKNLLQYWKERNFLSALLRVKKIPYQCYWSDRAIDETKRVILCGDSLCGVPFTRSLRNGL